MNKLRLIIVLTFLFAFVNLVLAQESFDLSETVNFGGTTFQGTGMSLNSEGDFSMSNGEGTVGILNLQGDFTGKATGNGVVEGVVGENGLKIGNDIIGKENKVIMNANTGEYTVIASEEGSNLNINGVEFDIFENGELTVNPDKTITLSEDTEVKGAFVYGDGEKRNFIIKSTHGKLVVDIGDTPSEEIEGNRIYLKGDGFTLIGKGEIKIERNINGHTLSNTYEGLHEDTMIKSFGKDEVLVYNPSELEETRIARSSHDYLIEKADGEIITVKIRFRYVLDGNKIYSKMSEFGKLGLKQDYKVLGVPDIKVNIMDLEDINYMGREIGFMDIASLQEIPEEIKKKIEILDFANKEGSTFGNVQSFLRDTPRSRATRSEIVALKKEDKNLDQLRQHVDVEGFFPLYEVSIGGERYNQVTYVKNGYLTEVLSKFGFSSYEDFLTSDDKSIQIEFINELTRDPKKFIFVSGINTATFLDTVKQSEKDIIDHLSLNSQDSEITEELISEDCDKCFVIMDFEKSINTIISQKDGKVFYVGSGLGESGQKKFVRSVAPIITTELLKLP